MSNPIKNTPTSRNNSFNNNNFGQITMPSITIASTARLTAARVARASTTGGTFSCLPSYMMAPLQQEDVPCQDPSYIVSVLEAVIAIVEDDDGSILSNAGDDGVFAQGGDDSSSSQ